MREHQVAGCDGFASHRQSIDGWKPTSLDRVCFSFTISSLSETTALVLDPPDPHARR